MQSLFDVEEDADSKRRLPQPIRRAIVQLKAEYSPFRPNELATICYVRFNRRPVQIMCWTSTVTPSGN
jgi:hypothetical protein